MGDCVTSSELLRNHKNFFEIMKKVKNGIYGIDKNWATLYLVEMGIADGCDAHFYCFFGENGGRKILANS